MLPSLSFKQFVSLIVLLLVTSSTIQSPLETYDCPSSCECNETTFSARCDDLNELIASFSAKDRQNLMPIKLLDLSNNQLTKLSSQLELLTNLTELNLSYNYLTQVQKLNFEHLMKLDLSHNRITSGKLKKLPKNVVHLNLSHNEITYLPVDFMKLKALRYLELAGNPLNCTCNTLHVRNYLSYNNVWTDKHILCASPSIVKGQPWLQARQSEICMEPSSTTTQRSKINWSNYEDDSENMMGDQPQPGPDDVEYEDDDYDGGTQADEEEKLDPFADASESPETVDEEKPEEESDAKSVDDMAIDEDFMPVAQEHDSHDGSTVEPEAVSKHVADLGNYDEGSGDENLPAAASEQPEDDGESGSGGFIVVPSVHNANDLESSTEEDNSISPLGIFEDNTESPIKTLSAGILAGAKDETEPILDGAQKSDVNTAQTDDNTGTYILLGILALCLISLMAFVAVKNRQEKNRNRRFDVEKNGATELQDMDKRLLGKPIDRNGNGNGPTEQAPLINNYPQHNNERPSGYTSFHPPGITVDEPKAAPREANKSQQSLYENAPNGQVEQTHKGATNGSASKPHDSEDEVFHPASENPASLNVSPEPVKRYSPIYTPASPRSERYSPVYSPETGRVKIKLTETPKPKTPVVVTRSRSRAGDYIKTPN